MKRMIVGPSKEMNGKYVIAVDPVLVYLDTCVWIEMFQAYRNKKERIIEKIAGAVGNDEFRLLVSTVNFFELIGTIGDISITQLSTCALPTVITVIVVDFCLPV